MKCLRILLVVLASLLVVSQVATQEKAKAATEQKAGTPQKVQVVVTDEQKAGTPLKVQIVFTEMDGEKKIGNLPFTLLLSTESHGRQTSLRLGLRVPIFTDKDQKLQYYDVGTNIDCIATSSGDGRYQIWLSFERSSIYSANADQKLTAGIERSITQPIIQQVRGNLTLDMRDGQTVQSVVATDPLSGRVLKLDVTLTVVK
ncbi:MAG TPA: hypothetical protein VI699_09505 [Candidatus Acidoferrales bacterium]|nr:hypothetical protein [Candidatus Acidoferrales bacterium]